MSILCGLGRHRAGPWPRWNEGYYFSTCSRCGRDLVRTPFEGWTVPTGYRVVWSREPPENRSRPKLQAEPAHASERSRARTVRAGDRPACDPSKAAAARKLASQPAGRAERADRGHTGPPAADMPIAEVLQILRDEERMTLKGSDPDADHADASLAQGKAERAEEEGAEPGEAHEARMLDLAQPDAINLEGPSVDPAPGGESEDGAVGPGRKTIPDEGRPAAASSSQDHTPVGGSEAERPRARP